MSSWGKGKWPAESKSKPAHPEWDEVFARHVGSKIEEITADGGWVNFRFSNGKCVAMQALKIGKEKRSFSVEPRAVKGKLMGAEIIKCAQVSKPGEVPVRAVATVAVNTDEDRFIFEAHNEHDGTSSNEAGFRFRCF